MDSTCVFSWLEFLEACGHTENVSVICRDGTLRSHKLVLANVSKFMENITRRKEEKAAAAKQGFTKSSDQISYIGQINNNNNNINNFFIQDASSLLQPSSINEQPKKAPLSAI